MDERVVYHWAVNGTSLAKWAYNSSIVIKSVAVDVAHRRLVVGIVGGAFNCFATLMWLDMAGGSEVLAYSLPGPGRLLDVAVSRDGSRLFVLSNSGNGQSDTQILVVQLDQQRPSTVHLGVD